MLNRLWLQYTTSYDFEETHSQNIPLGIVIVAMGFTAIALFCRFILALNESNFLNQYYIPLLLVWIAAAFSIWGYYRGKKSKPFFAIIQLIDSPLYAATLLSFVLLCSYPINQAFVLFFFMLVYMWSQMFPFSFLFLACLFVPQIFLIYSMHGDAFDWLVLFLATCEYIALSLIARKHQEKMRSFKLLEFAMQQNSRMAALGTLAAGMAHEINNPLAIITGYAQLISDHAPNHPGANKILQATKRIQKIISVISEFSKSQNQPDGVKSFCVHESIKSLLEIMVPALNEESIEIALDLTAGQSFTEGNPGRFQQAFINILTNAREAVLKKSDRKIIIRSKNIHTPTESIALSIEDNGLGIAKEKLAQIFDPFFTSKSPGKGPGLGLWITQSIIQQMNGTIIAHSRENEGTTITLFIPVLDTSKTIKEN